MPLLILAWAMLGSLAAEPGRWDHRRHDYRSRRPATTTTPPPTTTTTTLAPRRQTSPRRTAWEHSLGWERPAHRCQLEERQLEGGRPLEASYIDYVRQLLVEDRVLLAPVVFEGAMVSRTNTYKGLYFVSFKVFKVLKGSIHRQLTGQVRLLFQSHTKGRRSKGGHRRGHCPPVPFNVKSGRKYLIFVKQIKSAGRYAAVAEPEEVRKKTVRALRQSLACHKCGKLTVRHCSDLHGHLHRTSPSNLNPAQGSVTAPATNLSQISKADFPSPAPYLST